ncbi:MULTISPECIES: tetratricopeptide repeat-containing response regulator [unclassified Massilia]|uniref:tetratricopeptide repeat-containing response regulator n=1 Tax=unclassified Massilia TaxID=2609279 RepID=UPI00178676A3|nr:MULTISPECIES: tetratricopeptide repeat-containing response regulator [unclassified Massilia]MBD8529656.1 response regulator [Massilia sp. CFBP 13647]MBD8673257.1 response regulator [Massilia sp. CFBP 13721]
MNAVIPTKAEPIDWASKNYLVVDDFIGVRQLLRESLRSLGAKSIDQAASGGEAIALLAKLRYDVVLCDFNLGDGKNGQQVLEEARVRNFLLPSSVWMMVSAEKSVESVMGAAEHQPDAYLVKPITEGVLLTRLNRAWHRKQVFRPIDQAYAEKDYLRAARLCDERIEASPVHEVELLRMKARLMEKSGEPDKAREAYERVLNGREYQWARAGLAKIRLANGEFEQARQMFQGVIAENRYYIDAYDQLALAYQGMGKLEEACSILERAAKLSPNSVPRQRNLGQICLKLGNVGMAEKAFRKCIAIGEYSVRRTPDAYLGLARVCGLKNDPKEAQVLLLAAQREFGETHPDIELRAKITEGLVYHESGDYRRARKAGDELEALLGAREERPDTATCLEMATLLFAVGVKEAPVELLCYVIRNNHDNALLLDEVQAIFDKARLTDEGEALIRSSKKEAADLMNQGVLLWKTGKLQEAVDWMREARARLPNNQRILFNAAQVLVSHMRERGHDEALALEAHAVLAHVDRLQPGQQRFAQLMEQLAALALKAETPAVDTTA